MYIIDLYCDMLTQENHNILHLIFFYLTLVLQLVMGIGHIFKIDDLHVSSMTITNYMYLLSSYFKSMLDKSKDT